MLLTSAGEHNAGGLDGHMLDKPYNMPQLIYLKTVLSYRMYSVETFDRTHHLQLLGRNRGDVPMKH
jgi:hypothetical protein